MLTNMDHAQRVVKAANTLRLRRAASAVAEMRLQDAVSALIADKKGGLRDWARGIGISPAYACDLRHKRRKVSDVIVSKILGGGK